MSIAELPGPERSGTEYQPEAMTPDEVAYREAYHQLFTSRVAPALRSVVAKHIIRPHPTTVELSDDITEPSRSLVKADTERTAESLDVFSTSVYGISRKLAVINAYSRQHKLDEAKSVMFLTGHPSIDDLLWSAYLVTQSQLRPDHSAEGNQMIISPGLNYLDYRLPWPFSMSSNIAEEYILPVTNEIVAIPQTETTDELEQRFPTQVSQARKGTLRAMKTHQEEMSAKGIPVFTFMSPTGKQMQPTDNSYFETALRENDLLVCKTGGLVEKIEPGVNDIELHGLVMPTIPEGALGIIQKAHKRGTKVVFMGVSYPAVPALVLAKILPKFPGLPLTLKLGEPLPDRKLEREEITELVIHGLMKVSARTAKKPIYYQPE